ncbi:Sphingoid long-chain base transporter RSB1 [Lachnellula suecica]|uniref:Sphingoid long-chain base transporter RSB1 n=1 Tax=Lachnellula suecica TaxID=602035 RepID=A0A8T9CBJ3_9HELO|nr:Sphingoid long-chain base transporter RSB1 [Lachnellula suecica]
MASVLYSSMALVARERTRDKYALCTIATCPISTSYYFYRVSLAANAVFAALFAISLIGFLGTYAFTRRATAFTFAMTAGVILEVIGYAGRIQSNQNQWGQTGFLMQIVCLTIAPAFMAGGIYLCLRRIVYAFGPENSRISPEAYTRIFIPCDLLSLLLQAAGGGLASTASHQNKSPDTGDDIMVAGLAFQVLTLLVFMILCVDFAVRTRRRYKSMGQDAFDQNPIFVSMRGSWRFKGFIVALALATICIFWRSVYRVAELGEGWTGALIKRQWLFVGFEGVMVIVACFALNLFNPAFTFKEAMTGLGGLGSKKKLARQQRALEKNGSASHSDVDAVQDPKTIGV